MKIFFLVLLSVFFMNGLNAQKKSIKTTITGTVLDLDDKPIANAIIIIDNQKTNIITDSAGNYSVKVKSTASKIGVMTFGNGYKFIRTSRWAAIENYPVNLFSLPGLPILDTEESEFIGSFLNL